VPAPGESEISSVTKRTGHQKKPGGRPDVTGATSSKRPAKPVREMGGAPPTKERVTSSGRGKGARCGRRDQKVSNLLSTEGGKKRGKYPQWGRPLRMVKATGAT